jgi:hypothetical protein
LPRNKEILPDSLEYDWTIELQEGEITFRSIGFDLYCRSLPRRTNMQCLSLEERGGFSFSTPGEINT